MSVKRVPEEASEENSMAQPRRRTKANEIEEDEESLLPGDPSHIAGSLSSGVGAESMPLPVEVTPRDELDQNRATAEKSADEANVRLVECDMDCQ